MLANARFKNVLIHTSAEKKTKSLLGSSRSRFPLTYALETAFDVQSETVEKELKIQMIK